MRADYTYTTLDDSVGFQGTYVTGINNSGAVVGYFGYDTGAQYGFIESAGSYTTLGTNVYRASGINNLGEIVGRASFSNVGVIDNNGSFTYLNGPANSFIVSPYSINDAGTVSGSFMDKNRYSHGFLYNNGVYTTIDDPNAPSYDNGTFLTGTNNSGITVGYYQGSDSAYHGFIYHGSTFLDFNDPLGNLGTVLTGINDAGELVGYFQSSTALDSFVYSGGVFTTLNDPYASAGTYAYSINDAGVVAGTYNLNLVNPGAIHGFLATPNAVPEPASLVLMISSSISILLVCHRRRLGRYGIPRQASQAGPPNQSRVEGSAQEVKRFL